MTTSGIEPAIVWHLAQCNSVKGAKNMQTNENKVLRIKFGPKGMEITGEWRKLRKRNSFACLVFFVLLDIRRKELYRLSSTNLGACKYIENIIPEI